jgi:hypothetical protein
MLRALETCAKNILPVNEDIFCRLLAKIFAPFTFMKNFRLITGGFWGIFSMYFIQHCFICRTSDSTVSEDAGMEHRTVATLALAVRSSNNSARSHPLIGQISSTRRDLIHLIDTTFSQIHLDGECLHIDFYSNLPLIQVLPFV